MLFQYHPAGLALGQVERDLYGLVLARLETDLGLDRPYIAVLSGQQGEAQADSLVERQAESQQKQGTGNHRDLVSGRHHMVVALLFTGFFTDEVLPTDIDDNSVHQQIPADQQGVLHVFPVCQRYVNQ